MFEKGRFSKEAQGIAFILHEALLLIEFLQVKT